MMEKTRARFEKYVIPVTECGCHLWTASLLNNGYGCFRLGERTRRAHRVAFELYVGPIPEGMRVLHKCDVPSCVNPAHLFLGTQADNVVDKCEKGRQARGAEHARRSRQKLTDADVRDIRNSLLRPRVIAETLGISQSLVYQIRRHAVWRHVS